MLLKSKKNPSANRSELMCFGKLAVVVPLVTAVVLILLKISDKSCVCGAYHRNVVGSSPAW